MQKHLFGLFGGISCVAISLAGQQESAGANTFKYECQTSKGIPQTVAITPSQGRTEIIDWTKDPIGNITREQRCREVSKRFDEANQQGLLNFITHGMMGGKNVICVAKYTNAPCVYLLWTLRPEDDPRKILKDLELMSYKSVGPIQNASDGKPKIYIDMNLLLQKKPEQNP